MSACQIWVWLLNFHQERTKPMDTLELQVSKQIQYFKRKLTKAGPVEVVMVTADTPSHLQ